MNMIRPIFNPWEQFYCTIIQPIPDLASGPHDYVGFGEFS